MVTENYPVLFHPSPAWDYPPPRKPSLVKRIVRTGVGAAGVYALGSLALRRLPKSKAALKRFGKKVVQRAAHELGHMGEGRPVNEQADTVVDACVNRIGEGIGQTARLGAGVGLGAAGLYVAGSLALGRLRRKVQRPTPKPVQTEDGKWVGRTSIHRELDKGLIRGSGIGAAALGVVSAATSVRRARKANQSLPPSQRTSLARAGVTGAVKGGVLGFLAGAHTGAAWDRDRPRRIAKAAMQRKESVEEQYGHYGHQMIPYGHDAQFAFHHPQAHQPSQHYIYLPPATVERPPKKSLKSRLAMGALKAGLKYGVPAYVVGKGLQAAHKDLMSRGGKIPLAYRQKIGAPAEKTLRTYFGPKRRQRKPKAGP